MTTARAVLLAAAVIVAACAGAPPVATTLPESAFNDVDGSIVFERWPAVAQRPYPDAGQNGMPAGFVDEVFASGLAQPTSLRQLPDGSFIVTEQRGVVRHIAGSGASPTMVLDIRAEVFHRYQLGLLGLGIDPEFATQPYLYLAYTRDAPLGGSAPTYGGTADLDDCPTRSACPASARLVRYRVSGSPPSPDGEAQVLIEDWCIAGPNHTIGTIAFGRDGALFAGGGDGADGAELDDGQLYEPANACADPPAQGGSLRSQDLRLGSDPVSLDGTIVRIDRSTGAGLPDNPAAEAADVNARRIVGYGTRNPFRFTFRPGTDELWIADVGWLAYEEINRVVDPVGDQPFNLGWPCYEGAFPQPDWQRLDFEACRDLYADADSVALPAFSFARDADAGPPCGAVGAATSAIAFYNRGTFPEPYRDALFFADMAQQCLYVMQSGDDGLPDPRTARVFAGRVRVADLVVGADGALYYANVFSGELRRIRWTH